MINFRLVLLSVAFTLITKALLGQTLLIGSGLQEDTLLVLSERDTIFHDVISSQDHIDIYKQVQLSEENRLLSIYVNGLRVSTLFLNKKIVSRKTEIVVDFNFGECDGEQELLNVSFKFI
ncbi:hypothetical protein [Halocola ammonii]